MTKSPNDHDSKKQNDGVKNKDIIDKESQENRENNDINVENNFFRLFLNQFKKDFKTIGMTIKKAFKTVKEKAESRINNIKNRNENAKNITYDNISEEPHAKDEKFVYDKKNEAKSVIVAADNKESVKETAIVHVPKTSLALRHDSDDEFDNNRHNFQSLFRQRNRERSFILSSFLTTISIFILLIFFVGVSGLGAILGVANAYVDTTPVLDLAKIENLEETSFIYDDQGNQITTFSGLENRIYAPISEIPQILQAAIVATEDARFYTHNGVDPKRIVGAFFNNLRTDTTQGGSTLTQQLIKLRLLSYEQTYKRKLQEAYLALQLEQEYTKDQILEAYLNTIPLGAGNYGVKAAAQDYFGKELNQLTLREAAMLAGIAQSPYLYDLRKNYYVWDSPKRVVDRTNTVLYRMYQEGYITKAEYDAALTEDVFIKENSEKRKMYDMPYFLEYAIQDVVTHMLRSRNLPNSASNRATIENELRTGGYDIHTTVDRDMQLIVQDTLYNWDRYPSTMYKSDATLMVKNPDGTTQDIIQPQAAAAIYDYKTGYLKAIVGGRQEPTVRKGFNRAYQSHMPVGSSIKPIAVYGPALNKGISPATVILDLPLPVKGWISEKGYPNNYAGTFSGPVTVRTALKKSINMAAVRILVDHVTIDESYNTLINLGINPDYVNKDGAGLALGTSGINTIEMSVAFGAIANNGVYIEPVAFTKVVDSHGQVILDSSNSRITRQVFTPVASWLLVDMLKDAVKSGTGRSAGFSNMTVAGKTGTNSDYKGVFFAGMTPYYSAAVWIGHDGYEPLNRRAQGGGDAAPLWQAFMKEIHNVKDLPNKDILDTNPTELGLVKATICTVSGKLATEACSHDADGRTPVTDYFQAGTVPTEKCDQHVMVEVCNDTGLLATPYCPNTRTEAMLVIPLDSPINQLDDEKYMTYFKNAKRFIGDTTIFIPENYSDPSYAHYFCQVHTQEWYDNTNKMNDVVQIAEELIEEVGILVETYGEELNQNHLDQINTAKNDLIIIKNLRKNYDGIREAIDNLKILKQAYLDPLVEESADS